MMDARQKSALKKIKLLALDFDGTLTDGFVYVDEDGKESVRCSRRDSAGIKMLKESGVEVVVISSEVNPVVKKRCDKLKIKCCLGAARGKGKGSKFEILKQLSKEAGLTRNEVAYMGDDVNDLEAMEYAVFAVAVADAHIDVRSSANYITSERGGDHAVREICDMILLSKNS